MNVFLCVVLSSCCYMLVLCLFFAWCGVCLVVVVVVLVVLAVVVSGVGCGWVVYLYLVKHGVVCFGGLCKVGCVRWVVTVFVGVLLLFV